MHQFALWGGFLTFVFAMLALDLGVFNRKAHLVSVREALMWSAFWITLALCFNLGVYFFRGPDVAMKFLAGYLLEKSLSVDNLFVFLLIFSYFKVDPLYQHKVLFWGICGALVMRALFIFSGVSLIHRFHWVMYLFGAFLVFTGIKLAFENEKEVHPNKNPVIKLFHRFMGVTDRYEDGKFFVRRAGKLMATPLFIVLLVVETTDVLFAVDSIPAILAVSTDQFIVFSSNVFAILGLRALYFALAGLMELFHYLNYGLAFILVFIGIKMILDEYVHFPIFVALLVIVGTLAISIGASLLFPKKSHK